MRGTVELLAAPMALPLLDAVGRRVPIPADRDRALVHVRDRDRDRALAVGHLRIVLGTGYRPPAAPSTSSTAGPSGGPVQAGGVPCVD